MAYVPMNYTTGNWTVSGGATVTPTTTYSNGTKTVTVTNINYPSDFSYSRKTRDGNGNVYTGSTNVDTEQNRVVTIKDEIVSNVYNKATGTKDPSFKSVRQLSSKKGHQMLLKLESLDKVSNSVSAEEGDLYCSMHLVACIQDHPAVTSTYIKYKVEDFIGMLTKMDSTTLAQMFLDILGNDLNPTQ